MICVFDPALWVHQFSLYYIFSIVCSLFLSFRFSYSSLSSCFGFHDIILRLCFLYLQLLLSFIVMSLRLSHCPSVFSVPTLFLCYMLRCLVTSCFILRYVQFCFPCLVSQIQFTCSPLLSALSSVTLCVFKPSVFLSSLSCLPLMLCVFLFDFCIFVRDLLLKLIWGFKWFLESWIWVLLHFETVVLWNCKLKVWSTYRSFSVAMPSLETLLFSAGSIAKKKKLE